MAGSTKIQNIFQVLICVISLSSPYYYLTHNHIMATRSSRLRKQHIELDDEEFVDSVGIAHRMCNILHLKVPKDSTEMNWGFAINRHKILFICFIQSPMVCCSTYQYLPVVHGEAFVRG